LTNKKTSPFDYVNSISFNKEYIEDKDDYVPYLTNKALSHFGDTVFYADEMNRRGGNISSDLQYDYLYHSIPAKKRYSGKWHKNAENEDLEIVKQEYKYSEKKAKEALQILNEDQLKILRQKYDFGGAKK